MNDKIIIPLSHEISKEIRNNILDIGKSFDRTIVSIDLNNVTTINIILQGSNVN